MIYYVDLKTYQCLKRGLFAVNKTKGITSAKTLELIKDIVAHGIVKKSETSAYRLRAGHGGTLDSDATGVLVVGLLDGCKLLSKYLHGYKEYDVTGRLGIATDTYNRIGKETLSAPYGHVTESKLEEALNKYQGKIIQVPPKYSALKRNGSRLSDIFRSGGRVPVEGREVYCDNIRIIEFNPPHFRLSVSCGSGFYVRSLIHDVGLDVGSCAHVSELVRTRQGAFSLEDCLPRQLWTKENIIKAAISSQTLIQESVSSTTSGDILTKYQL